MSEEMTLEEDVRKGREAYDAVIAGGGRPIDAVMASALVWGVPDRVAMNLLFDAGLDLVQYEPRNQRNQGKFTTKLEWVR